MGELHRGKSFRAAHHADHRDAHGSGLLELACSLAGTAAGGEHGVQQEHIRSREVGGEIRIVGVRQGRFLVSLDAHMGDHRVRHEGQNAIQQAEAGAQDGHANERACQL